MKKQSNLSLLFNPFERIAGSKALIVGLIFFIISTALAHLGGVVFNGILSIQLIPINLTQAFIVHGLSLLLLILVMYVTGLIFSPSSIRFIDVVGTMTLSRAPLVLVGAMVSLPIVNGSWRKFVSSILMGETPSDPLVVPIFICSMIVTLICIIWFIVLAYNAFSVSCNIKGMKNNIVFTVSLVLTFVICLFISAKFLPVDLTPITSANQMNVESVLGQKENYEIINRIAEQAAKDISEEKYDNVVSYFDDKMKEALTIEKLAEIMKAMEANSGKIVKVENEVKNTQVDGYRVVMVPVQFEKKSLYFRFTFDDRNKIVGFYM